MFAGFDRDDYGVIGDSLAQTIKANTNLRWVGFYLAHRHDAAGSSWTAPRTRIPQVTTWQFLRSEGWGLAPLFLGLQFVSEVILGPDGQPLLDAQGRPRKRFVTNPAWTETNGVTDGNHAADLARGVGMETGATIYIDFEAGGVANVPQAMHYLRGWADAITARGYRPGTYCSHLDVVKIGVAFPNIVIWVFDIPLHQTAVFNETTQQLQLPHPSAWTNAGQGEWPVSMAWQFAWYNPDRAIAAVNFSQGPGLPPHHFVKIDFDAARVPDPSHPEDGGALMFSPYLPSGPAAFAISPGLAIWTAFEAGAWDQFGAVVVQPASVGIQNLGYEPWFETAGAVTSRRSGHLDLFGVGIDGSVWTAWKNPVEEWPDHPWVLNPGAPARSGSPIAAVSRTTDVLDVFYINKSHELVTQWWTINDFDWQAHIAPITHGFGFSPGTNISAATSPTDSGRLDVFGIDSSNLVRWVQWRSPGPWREEIVPNVVNADPNLGVHAVHHGDLLHLIVGGRDGSLNHLTHSGLNHGAPQLWSLPFSIPPLDANVRPVAIRIASLGDLLVAVGLAANGAFFWSAWNGITWTLPGVDFGSPMYSTQGRLAILPFDNQTLDVMLVNQARKTLIRRLVRTGNPLAPLTPAQTWELLF